MNCPGCTKEMSFMTLDAHIGPPVGFDICTACQAFWFDLFKNLHLAVGSTLKLMKFISENPPAGTITLPDNMNCPKCSARLHLTHDFQRATRFSYWRCEQECGRFIGFMDFLREKDFIHPLSPQQIDVLRQNVQILSCSHCGAPIDLTVSTSCTHCGSPLSLLDMPQSQRMIEEMKDPPTPKPIDANLVNEIAMMRMKHGADSSFAALRANSDWAQDVSAAGVVHACLNAVMRWMKANE